MCCCVVTLKLNQGGTFMGKYFDGCKSSRVLALTNLCLLVRISIIRISKYKRVEILRPAVN